MQSDCRAILQLVAMGRVTPAEAERLLAVWNEGRESTWVLAGCAVLAVAAELQPLTPGMAHWIRGLAQSGLPVAHHAVSVFAGLLGISAG
jgi:hypothetical protein